MQPTSPKTSGPAVIALIGLVGVAVLTGCTSLMGLPSPVISGGSSQSSTAAASAEPIAPWDDPAVPTVVIEFEQDGVTHTVSGEIEPGLQTCKEDGSVFLTAKSPSPGIGVMFTYKKDTPISSSVWIVGDEFAAQVLAKGVVEATPTEDGGINYSTIGATGRISALPREEGKPAISDYNFSGLEQFEGTASFTVSCPAAE